MGRLLAEFVRSMQSDGELTSWTVALIGSRQGRTYNFGSGVSTKMPGRKEESSTADSFSIGRLLSPRDEAIDLDESAWQAALERTQKHWESGQTRAKTRSEPPDDPAGPMIREIRGNGAAGVAPARERGLLLLYALDPQESNNIRLATYGHPVMAFGASFPKSESGTKVEYKVDHLTWEQEYVAG